MVRLESTRDFALIRTVMTNPKVYPHLADDFHPPPEQFWPNEHLSIHYLLAFDGDELLGLFITYPVNPLLWQVDHALLPTSWGRRSREAAKAFLAWLWENTAARQIFGMTPACNQLAVRFATSLGLREQGRLSDCYQRGGRLFDLIILGRGRPQTKKET